MIRIDIKWRNEFSSLIRWMIKTNSSHFAYYMNVFWGLYVCPFSCHTLCWFHCIYTYIYMWKFLQEWGMILCIYTRGVNVYAWLDYLTIISPSSRHVILYGGHHATCGLYGFIIQPPFRITTPILYAFSWQILIPSSNSP